MLKIKFIAIISVVFILGNSMAVHADKYGIDQTAGDAGLPKIADVPTALGNVLGVALSMVAVVFFVLMLYSGIMWMIARGNEEKEEKAKETIIGAVIGMIVIMLSYSLTTFVFKGTTGGTITKTPAFDMSMDGKYCVMKDKPTVCTQINGDEKNCVSSVGIFSTEAQCGSALKGSPTGVAAGKCVSSISPGAIDQKLQTILCNYAISKSTPDTIEDDCNNKAKTDDGMNLCEYNLNGVNGLHCILSAHIDLNSICASVAENNCNDKYEYKLASSQYGGIAGICEWK